MVSNKKLGRSMAINPVRCVVKLITKNSDLDTSKMDSSANLMLLKKKVTGLNRQIRLVLVPAGITKFKHQVLKQY